MNEKAYDSKRESTSDLEANMPEQAEDTINSMRTPPYRGLKGALIAGGSQLDDSKRVIVWGWTDSDY